MSILKIAKLGHPILLKKTAEVKEIASESIKKIIYDMTETMLDANAIGLAAPQVHINKRIFVYQNPDTVTNESNIKITALINPKIEKVSEQINDSWEGCLSIPGMLGLVRRFTKIEYSGYDTFSLYNRLYGYFLGPSYNEIGGVYELTSSSGGDGGGYFAVKR